MKYTLYLIFALFFLINCGDNKKLSRKRTKTILVTSESGNKLSSKPNIDFKIGAPTGNIVEIFPDSVKQTFKGIGTSFTESSAFVLAHLEPSLRKEVMEKIYGESGANFSIARTHIGSCDFSVEGKYAYVESGDELLETFTLEEDKVGFSKEKYAGIKDENYDLLNMIKEAQAIKKQQADPTLNIIASAWTAPDWMKDIETWFIKGSEENNWQGTGGSLKPEYVSTYTDYLLKYLKAYASEGVDIWGLTPVNEPNGNSGQWESMHFSPETQRDFIKKYLGPQLKEHAPNVKLLIYDQNREHLKHWTDVILGDKDAAQYVEGTAIHWYSNTEKVYEDVLDEVHHKFPNHTIFHTEGCIDDLGKPAPNGIEDPIGFQEKNWFKNDDFWWNKNATDWGYTAPWAAPTKADHPMYTPVHRYARNIIVSTDHWMSGWVDWNIVLDHQGGPNHAGNYCGAPIMINPETQEIYYTPIYHVLAQLSKTMRPGDKVIQTKKSTGNLGKDALHVCASVNKEGLISIQYLNTTKAPIATSLKIGEQFAEIVVEANAIQTVQVPVK